MPTTAILGGGLSGLSAAYYLSRALPNERIVLIDKAARLGGWIETTTTKDGVSFETGPRSVRPVGLSGHLTLDLIRQLGLVNQLVTVSKKHPAAQNRYIFYNGKLNRAPNSLLSALTASFSKSPFQGLISALAAEPFRSAGNETDESIDNFVSRRLGPRFATNVLSALVHGIYAGDTRRLSIRAVFPSLWKMEKQSGSIIRGLLGGTAKPSAQDVSALKDMQERLGPIAEQMKNVSVYSLKDGLGTLPTNLEHHLRKQAAVKLQPDTQVHTMTFSKGDIQLDTNKGALIASRVISALPSTALYHLVPLSQLSYNPSVTVGVVNLAFDASYKLPVTGFGYLIPRSVSNAENPHHALGVIFDSDTFSDAKGLTKVTVMLGGHYWDRETVPSGTELEEAAVDTLRRHGILPQSVEPVATQVRIQKDCIPQYLLGHVDRMQALHRQLLEQYGGRLSVVGSSYNGVGLNDCIKGSWEVTTAIAAGRSCTGLEGFLTL